jgi:hypothetical protein
LTAMETAAEDLVMLLARACGGGDEVTVKRK